LASGWQRKPFGSVVHDTKIVVRSHFKEGGKRLIELRRSALCILTFVGLAALTGSAHGQDKKQDQINDHQKDAANKEETVTKGSKDINEVVNQPMEALHRALKLGMETYGFDVEKDKPDYLEGTRSRKVGVFVGSGGEKVKITLKEEKPGTRVKIETGKGFVGRLGKANWSTPIFKEAMKTLEGK
jgi:hypothetical protein